MTGASGEYAVFARGVEKSYRDWPVLWDLDLTVSWGESLALFGANGAGKTTLLRILSTSVRPDAGAVRVAGRDLRRQSAQVRQRIGVLGHRSFLYDDLTPRENLTYYARLYGIRDRAERVNEVLQTVGLSRRADHRVRSLSNGMQRRASIARAILHRPEVLLLDEPEAGLDRDSRLMLGGLLSEWAGAGRAVIFTTHDIELGMAWGSRSAVLGAGNLSVITGGMTEIQQALSQSQPARSDL